MPISCLPSGEGIGTLGSGAYAFVDYLKDAGADIWQILPLNPTGYGDSPYQSCSSDALNYYFIDLETLANDGLLTDGEIAEEKPENPRRVDYNRLFTEKIRLLRLAYSRFYGGEEFEEFKKAGVYADFALFMSLKTHFAHRAFTEWEEPFRTYRAATAEKFAKEHADEINFWQFTQFMFLKQWRALKAYANAAGVRIMGDIPLYVAYDSVEVWKYGAKLFKCDAKRNPSKVAGVPPDVFSADGQLWGNPVYNWRKMKDDGYSWWNRRIDGCMQLFDMLRIDHFRGFDRYYEIPAGDTTAMNGKWVSGPKEDFFADKLDYDIVAEDLGVTDNSLKRFMKRVGFPGMRVLSFAFDGNPASEHKPSNHVKNCVAYTGTHDNMPLKGYFDALQGGELHTCILDVLAECERAKIWPRLDTAEQACETVTELCFASVADTAILPMWDVLSLGAEARINFPSTVSTDNWSWRFIPADFTPRSALRLKTLAKRFKRVK